MYTFSLFFLQHFSSVKYSMVKARVAVLCLFIKSCMQLLNSSFEKEVKRAIHGSDVSDGILFITVEPVNMF